MDFFEEIAVSGECHFKLIFINIVIPVREVFGDCEKHPFAIPSSTLGFVLLANVTENVLVVYH